MKNKVLRHTELPCTNRYAVLADKDNEDIMDEYNTDEEEQELDPNSIKTKNTKTRRPPPLVIHGKIKTHAEFMKALKDTVKENYHIKYHDDFTEVFTSNHEQHSLLKKIWQQKKINFHTYTDKNDKRRTYVIKGLHNQTDITEIKQDLNTLGYQVANLNIMKNTKQSKHMVTLLGNVQIKQLNQQAKYICSTKITWEHYINKRRITQCRRCQGWGHATINCYADPACLKCAQGHFTKDCQKSKDIPAKCVNCDLDHPANATICQEYQRRLKIIEHRTNIGKSTNTKPILDLSDRKQYPNLRNTSLRYQRKDNNVQQQSTRETMRHTSDIQQEDYGRDNNEALDGITILEGSNQAPARTLYSDITNRRNSRYTLGNDSIDASANNQNNISDLSDFISLSSEIRELTKVFNVKKMLTAVREFRRQLIQCNTPSQQFQLLIQFCDKLDNE